MAKKTQAQRKAKAAERAVKEEARAAAAPAVTKKASFIKKSDSDAKATPAKAEAKSPAKKNGFFARVRTWFNDVKLEMHRVTWPSKTELKNYSVAVIIMLVVFGVAVWLVDTGVVAALVGYSGLRG